MKVFWAPQTRSIYAPWILPETVDIGGYANRCLARPAFQKATGIAGG